MWCDALNISLFTVTICACADNGHLDQDCEIAIDLKYWMRHNASCVMYIYVCISCILECAWEGILFQQI